ncbi:MAG TPA: acetoacetate decarboxylase family protein [Acidimicrobiales bacterium]|nr:acetoacetate decarboxylase family protein [Acidimicrobiales bacterium]
MTTPDAPWTLGGEALVALARRPSSSPALPMGLHRLPGPLLIVGACYESSPVGPYLELAVGEPARLGLRPGWCFTTMVVDSPESRRAGRISWGLPKEVGRLTWRRDGDERELRWAERDIVVRGQPHGVPLPGLFPLRALQRRADGPVVAPGRLRGRAHVASVRLVAPAADPLAGIAGVHPGAHLTSMRLVLRPARHPVGLTSTLRAPLRAPEPALSSCR